MNAPNRTPCFRTPCRAGAARAAGVVVLVLLVALAAGMVYVVKGYLQSPAPTHGASDANTAGGRLSGGSGRGSTVPKGSFSAEMVATFETANAALARRDYPRAAAILKRMLENPDVAMDANVRLALAEALLGQDEFAESYKQYEAALALEGDKASPAIHFQAGTVASKAGMLDRAEEHYSMAQTADPSRAEYPLYLAMVQLRQGKTDPGVASLLRVVKLNPEVAEAWGTLAEVYLRENKLEIALPNIRRARELQPQFSRWRVVEARVLKRQGDPTSALNLLLAMDPADQARPEAMQQIAECYGMLRRPGDAAEVYERAAKREPTNAVLHYEAALWFQRAGDVEKARAHARHAAMLGHEPAAELQRSLG